MLRLSFAILALVAATYQEPQLGYGGQYVSPAVLPYPFQVMYGQPEEDSYSGFQYRSFQPQDDATDVYKHEEHEDDDDCRAHGFQCRRNRALGGCVCVSRRRANYYHAKKVCLEHRMQLVSINSPHEQESLVRDLKTLPENSFRRYLWTSGTFSPQWNVGQPNDDRSGREGTWFWALPGHRWLPLSYQKWRDVDYRDRDRERDEEERGRPERREYVQNCLALDKMRREREGEERPELNRHHGHGHFSWVALNCLEPHRFVCTSRLEKPRHEEY